MIVANQEEQAFLIREGGREEAARGGAGGRVILSWSVSFGGFIDERAKVVCESGFSRCEWHPGH